jgi:hypothetical protein
VVRHDIIVHIPLYAGYSVAAFAVGELFTMAKSASPNTIRITFESKGAEVRPCSAFEN